MGDKPVGSSREHQTLGCIWKNPDMPWTCSGSPSYSSVCNAIRAAVRSDCSRNRYPPRCKLQKHLIVWVNDPCSGWWLFTNPSEKYWCVKLGSYSTILGVKIKMFWNNHLDVSIKWRTLKSNYWGGNFLVGLVNGLLKDSGAEQVSCCWSRRVLDFVPPLYISSSARLHDRYLNYIIMWTWHHLITNTNILAWWGDSDINEASNCVLASQDGRPGLVGDASRNTKHMYGALLKLHSKVVKVVDVEFWVYVENNTPKTVFQTCLRGTCKSMVINCRLGWYSTAASKLGTPKTQPHTESLDFSEKVYDLFEACKIIIIHGE